MMAQLVYKHSAEDVINDETLCRTYYDAKICRNPTITQTNNLAYTSETVVKQCYKLARILHETLTKANITYWMSGGTLLGCLRHKGLIPWDDDVDVCVYKEDMVKIEQILTPFLKDHDCSIVDSPGFGYKVFHNSDSEKIPGNPFNLRYPFADIFVMERKGDMCQFFEEKGRVVYPQMYFKNKDVENGKPRLYGDVYLNCIANPEEYLRRNYGEDWYTKGATHNLDHMNNVFMKPLRFELNQEHYKPAKPFR